MGNRVWVWTHQIQNSYISRMSITVASDGNWNGGSLDFNINASHTVLCAATSYRKWCVGVGLVAVMHAIHPWLVYLCVCVMMRHWILMQFRQPVARLESIFWSIPVLTEDVMLLLRAVVLLMPAIWCYWLTVPGPIMEPKKLCVTKGWVFALNRIGRGEGTW